MNSIEFGDLLKNARIEQGYTQNQLSQVTGFTLRTIQYWERGGKSISLENAEKVLNALKMEIRIKS